MFRTLRTTAFIALTLVLVVSTVALAAHTVSGTLQKIDQKKERITLKSDEGKTMALQAPAALLANLQAGDAVEVRLSGKQATAISKQGKTSPKSETHDRKIETPTQKPPYL